MVWNPWDKGATIGDLDAGGEQHFVCVEAAAAGKAIGLHLRRIGLGNKT